MTWLRTLLCCMTIGGATTASAQHGLTTASVDQLPDGLNERIAAAIDPHGTKVTGDGGDVCTVWLAKSLPAKAKFKPSLTVKYPFTMGELAGAMQVSSGDFTDFRGQPIKPGVYTLRYGQQPQDGNHVGTSELSDFLLAIPASADADPAPLKMKPLFKQSAKATGSNHPAIFSLLPAEEKSAEPKLEHDGGKEFWILQLTATGKTGDSETPVPMRLVVIGKSEA